MKIMQLTVHYSPNIGGVETHLGDLTAGLVKRGHRVWVLTYRPLTAKVGWSLLENDGRLTVIRIPWLAGLFYRLVQNPILEFLYLMPGLFIITPFVLLASRADVIHAHGLVAGFVGTFWGKAFKRRVVISTHSIYNFSSKSLYSSFVRSIFIRADCILTLSKQSAEEVIKLGIKKEKIKVFIYWVDLKVFRRIKDAKKNLKWGNKFVVLFVGRLVEEKGVLVLLDAAKIWNKNITLSIIGTGPLEERIKNFKFKIKNFIFLGNIENTKLPIYYSAADLLIVPSIHEEGFGRVILESLACGTPVIGSNRGAIPEAIDESVGSLIKINSNNINQEVENYYKNPLKLDKLSKNAVKFAKSRYSIKNIETIINAYGQ
jgi:glycosyltransferase involved in cell wall biosynthesis